MKRSLPVLAVVVLLGLTAAFAQRPPKSANVETIPPKAKLRPAPPARPVPALRAVVVDPDAPKLRRVQVVSQKAAERIRKVITLNNAPALDAAESINKLLEGERPSRMDEVTIVAEPIGNRLLVSATTSMLKEVVQLIEEIDVKPKSVMIEALIAVVEREDKTAAESPLARFRENAPSPEEVAALIDKFKKNANVEFLAQPMVTALNNQPAFIQFGRRVPRVSKTVTEKGRTSNVEYDNVGLILGVTCRICDDNRVTMEIDLEKSDVAGTDGTGATVVDVTTAQTTVTAESGQPVVLGELQAESSASAKEVILIATPRILDGSSE